MDEMIGQDPNTDATSTDNANTGGQEGGSDRVFTQEEVNAIISQRLERAKLSWQKDLPDIDSLKAKAEKFDQLEMAKKTEAELLADQLAQAQARAVEAETRATEQLMKAAVMVEASRMKFRSPEIAWQLLDLSMVSIDDNGKVVGVKECLEALAEEHEYLIEKPKAPGLDAARGTSQRAQPVKLTAEEQQAAEALGMTLDAYAAMKQAGNVEQYRKLTKEE